MRLESHLTADQKRLWRIVRTDTYEDVPGEIVAADEATGECSVKVRDETKSLNFGPGGIRLVGRGR